jgi:linoleoyl-CoA desaturase
MPLPKFTSTPHGSAFLNNVREEVAALFRTNRVSPHANTEMIFKIVFWIACWVISYTCMIRFRNVPPVAVMAGVIHMFTHLAIAFNIAHDANHFALFRSKKKNVIFGYLMELLGCNKRLWIEAHNREHHTFINIHKHDNNIDGYYFLRLSPDDEWKPHHRYQWMYATIIYALSTLNYAIARDVKMIVRYWRRGTMRITFQFMCEFLFFKAIYYGYLVVIPIIFFQVSWTTVLTFFLIGHMINGTLLVFIFLTGHLTEDTTYPQVKNDAIEDNWAVHVIKTTCDYAPHSATLLWLFGSLNLHVAHHLFPNICHVHYKHITPTIKRLALAYGFCYREMPTFSMALRSHFKLLKELGKCPARTQRAPLKTNRLITPAMEEIGS